MSERVLPHVSTYTRVLPVSLERLYENALDWEHLPWLHRSTFSSIDCLDAGPWGWRADVGLRDGGSIVLELTLDRECRRWITSTLDGSGAGTEIWTHPFEVDDAESTSSSTSSFPAWRRTAASGSEALTESCTPASTTKTSG